MNLTRTDAEGLILEVKDYIDFQFADWGCSGITVIGKGLEFLVLKAYSRKWGEIAIKIPWERHISNDNDIQQDARDLLYQEFYFGHHFISLDLPEPIMHHLHIGGDLDFLVMEYIRTDNSPIDMALFGKFIKTVHESPLPTISLVAQGNENLHSILTERICRRIRTMEKLSDHDFPFINPESVSGFLKNYQPSKPSLLHMDARPENLLTRQGHIAVLIDWSNALTGDPCLELARIHEYGHLSRDFLQGYGNNGLETIPETVWDIYLMDTAVMLAIVFLSEQPDKEKGKKAVERVNQLYQRIIS